MIHNVRRLGIFHNVCLPRIDHEPRRARGGEFQHLDSVRSQRQPLFAVAVADGRKVASDDLILLQIVDDIVLRHFFMIEQRASGQSSVRTEGRADPARRADL